MIDTVHLAALPRWLFPTATHLASLACLRRRHITNLWLVSMGKGGVVSWLVLLDGCRQPAPLPSGSSRLSMSRGGAASTALLVDIAVTLRNT
jgi:hypothetical protein